jgi:RimJ/RimL family protein N-acetyltransferase
MPQDAEHANYNGAPITGRLAERLQGPRLTLRPLELTDAPRFARFGSDYDIARMTGSFPRYFPQISAEFRIMHMTSQKHRGLSFNYAVTEKGEDKLIGVMDLFRSGENEMLEIGYWIATPFWNRNYATEAGQIILKAAQQNLGVKRIKAGVFMDNPASLRVLEKLGFERRGAIEPFFSMARLEKADSINLQLDLDKVGLDRYEQAELTQLRTQSPK